MCKFEKCSQLNTNEYRFLLEADEMHAKMLAGLLDDSDINCTLVPFGSGVRTAMGLSLGKYKIYVMHKDYNVAKSIVSAFKNDDVDNLKEDLIIHRQLWNITPKNAKKLCKKIKLSDADELFEYINKIINESATVFDGGLISSCANGGHYIFIKVDSLSFCFNSATYEIFI